MTNPPLSQVLTDELKGLSREIKMLPKEVQDQVLPCARKITKLVDRSGDAGLFAIALVYEIIQAKARQQ